ncbi:hypothetical protein POX_e07133 [Penicillium oxalicum]|uniref:hypothetical protein n=1 Tax=Penicillium oxalicum TaxID=69781 RepID=UPI0020B7D666|nr:hypothetical protein POX_e07133 [Penicillium oxalicum]KAI2789105.1 hypothetical protein POX_e07133 [Penicillium oxalicum]
MQVESRVELPDGHLVNLSSRYQHDAEQSQPRYQAYRVDYNVNELSASPVAQVPGGAKPFELGERTPPNDGLYRAKATKLPISKTARDVTREKRNETSSPTGIPKPSSRTFSSGGSSRESSGRGQYWSKIRDKVDRTSPLVQRVSYVRSRESDHKKSPRYRNYRTCSGTSQSNSVSGREKSPDSSVLRPSPYGLCSDQSIHQVIAQSANWTEPRTTEDSWIAAGLKDSNLHKLSSTDSTSDISPDSNNPISPVSDDDHSADWEDRFVVHMPSAKEPNPPTMTAQEIAEYQKRIEREHREGRRVVGEVAAINPQQNPPSNADSSSAPKDELMRAFVAYDGGSAPLDLHVTQSQSQSLPKQEQQPSPAQPPPGSTYQDYFSPDEVGNHRISTIWEESPSKVWKGKTTPPADGSFLGCKEINGDGTKNPDEILLFGSGENSANLHPRPLAIKSKKKQVDEGKTSNGAPISGKSQDKSTAAEGRTDASQNLRRLPCSKSSVLTMCRDTQTQRDLPRRASQSSKKESPRSWDSAKRSAEKLEDTPGDDDVFIITPIMTRTMIPVPGKRDIQKRPSAPKPHGLRRPGDVGHSIPCEAVRAVRAVPQVVSTHSVPRPTAGKLQSSSTMHSVESSDSTQSHATARTQKSHPLGSDPEETIPSVEKKAKFHREIKFIRSMPLLKSPTGQGGNGEESGTTPSSIRGFIRTTGLARPGGLAKSPTDHLADILRNGTESIRSRAEILRKGRKESPVSVPSRENSESSHSKMSFASANDSSEVLSPPSPWSSPKKISPTVRVLFADSQPEERRPSHEMSSPRPTVKEPVLSETSGPTVQIPLVVDEPKATIHDLKPAIHDANSSVEVTKSATEEPKPGKLTRAQRLEKFKEEARIRRAARMAKENMMTNEKKADVAGLAELDGRQVTGRKNKLQSNITDVQDVCEDLHELNARDKDDYSRDTLQPFMLTMIFEIVVVAVTSVHRFGLQAITSPSVKFVAVNLAGMLCHCYRVSVQIYHAASQYQVSGTWPDMSDDQAVRRFFVNLLQAIVYLFVLGLSALVVYRAVGYCYLVVSWFLWLTSPFAWLLHCTTRALIM